jgi:hypothetical protein
MQKSNREGKVIQGPWPENLLERALQPDQRAGRLLPADHRCRLLSTRYHDDWEDWPRRRRTLSEPQPVLQYNLPFPDMPSLGQIARNRSLRPAELALDPDPAFPQAIRRCMTGFVSAHFNRIDASQLMQDPDWYENFEIHDNQESA